MLNYDELLQRKIDQLESGLPLDEVLRDLPEDAQEVRTLIQLAAAVRTIPHPEPLAEQVSDQRKRVLAAAQANTRPIQRPPQPVTPPKPQPKPRPDYPQPKSWSWFAPAALLSAAGMAVVFLAFVVVGTAFWFSNRAMDTARVEQVTGQAQVATNQAGTEWKNIQAGYRLREGQQIRTLGASSVTLRFFEGTRTLIAPNSDVTFARLDGSRGKAIQVEMVQASGETWNIVTPLQGKRSFFLVRAPGGVASVHGTSFDVKVSRSGQTQFSVNRGEVRVKNDSREVTLLAGQVTTANPSGEMTDPNYLFDVQGSLTYISEEQDMWTVSGVTFLTNSLTDINVTTDLGQTVKASGYVDESGAFIAQTINPATSEQSASFTGTLEEMEEDMWLISGTSVWISDGSGSYLPTIIDSRLAIGDPVQVYFNVLGDGTWLAEKIESLVEDPQNPGDLPTPTATADPRAMPSYSFEPDELESQACGKSEFDVVGTLRNTSGGAKDYAANVQLSYLIDRGGEYVQSVELIPGGWSRINPGQSVSFTARLTMNESWASSSEDAQVKLRVFISSATNRPDHLNGRLTITIHAGCEVEKSVTPTNTPTATPTGTGTQEPSPTPTVTPTPIESEEGQCTGADPHPTGMKLAQRYGVPYEEIMQWFCDFHYGFGEIDLAYSMSRQSGMTVQEVFDLRAGGAGWGDIKKQVLEGEKLDKNKEYDPNEDVDGDGNIDKDDDVDKNGIINDHDKKIWKVKKPKKDK